MATVLKRKGRQLCGNPVSQATVPSSIYCPEYDIKLLQARLERVFFIGYL